MFEVTVVVLAILALYKAQIVMARVDDVLREETTNKNPPEFKQANQKE